MKYAPITQTELKELFKRYIAMDMEDLLRKTGSSRTTILRRLKDIGYLTSYNHNGKYFALPEFLNFDDSGLFEHKGIYFFKKGGLQELIIHQINSSEKGYNAHELKIEYGIKISDSGITHLSDNFLIYCMCVHELASTEIKEVQDKRGGYVLHIDATVEEDSDMVFVGMNSVNGWVLHSKKIASESSEEIIPALEEINRRYGGPLAIKRDMGKGMKLAVSEVFPNKPDKICHYHFSRDIGKDILSEQYDSIRKFMIDNKIRTSLRRLADDLITEINSGGYDVNPTFDSIVNCRLSELRNNKPVYVYAIVSWILHYSKEGNGLGFPFDLPYVSLFERCCKARKIVERFILLLAEIKI